MRDGFVITAFVTKRFAALDRRPQLWPAINADKQIRAAALQ
jgi:hypothetical protein